MDFVALDFETATSKASSACQLGVVKVSQSRIVEEKCWLIRPPRLYFSPRNIAVHGIRPNQVRTAPNMQELWDELEPWLKGQILVAHNARFDIGVLVASLAHYELPCPSLEFHCTRVLARQVWPGRSRYGLKPLGQAMGIRFKHHDALEDARCCAKLAILAAQENQQQSWPELEANLKIKRGRFDSGRIRSPSAAGQKASGFGGRQTSDRWGFPDRRANLAGQVDPSLILRSAADNRPLSGKRIVLLGPLRGLDFESSARLLAQLGAECQAEVSSETHFVIACGGVTLEEAAQVVCKSLSEGADSNDANSGAMGASKAVGVRLLSERQFRALLPGGKAAAW